MQPSTSARICTPLCAKTERELKEGLSSALDCDLVELRLDCLESPELQSVSDKMDDVLQGIDRPAIITLRGFEQGGLQALDLDRRKQFFLNVRPRTGDFLDIELELVSELKIDQINWDQVICSHHDFGGVPSDLMRIYEQLAKTPARILKVAVKANDVTDCIPIFKLLDRARAEGRTMIAIAMEQSGAVTRVLGPSRGSFLTYGALGEESGTAPGQITAEELIHTYRIRNITEQTRVVGLVGLPTGHSISPHVHNAAFESTQTDAVYLRFEVRDLEGFITRMVDPRSRELDLNIRGLSITAPHKSAVLPFLDWVDPAAKEIGAVNTVVVDGEQLRGYNTDAEGFLKPLLKKVGSLKGIRCAVIGAGGAARTAVWVLTRNGASVGIFARREDAADRLAQEFGVGWSKLDEASQFGKFDVVVNATPLGTRGPLQQESVVTTRQLCGARLLYDLVYNPSETQLMREAIAAGCETMGGVSMLVGQALAQFKLWTGLEAPEQVMRTAAEQALR